MDDKFISVNRFKETLSRLRVEGGNKEFIQGIAQALSEAVPKLLDDEPATDVQLVKRGKWDTKDVVKILASGKTLDGFCQCDNCGSVYPLHYAEYAYCPNCGANMRGDPE